MGCHNICISLLLGIFEHSYPASANHSLSPLIPFIDPAQAVPHCIHGNTKEIMFQTNHIFKRAGTPAPLAPDIADPAIRDSEAMQYTISLPKRDANQSHI